MEMIAPLYLLNHSIGILPLIIYIVVYSSSFVTCWIAAVMLLMVEYLHPVLSLAGVEMVIDKIMWTTMMIDFASRCLPHRTNPPSVTALPCHRGIDGDNLHSLYVSFEGYEGDHGY